MAVRRATCRCSCSLVLTSGGAPESVPTETRALSGGRIWNDIRMDNWPRCPARRREPYADVHRPVTRVAIPSCVPTPYSTERFLRACRRLRGGDACAFTRTCGDGTKLMVWEPFVNDARDSTTRWRQPGSLVEREGRDKGPIWDRISGAWPRRRRPASWRSSRALPRRASTTTGSP
jgi:hypothetical protein